MFDKEEMCYLGWFVENVIFRLAGVTPNVEAVFNKPREDLLDSVPVQHGLLGIGTRCMQHHHLPWFQQQLVLPLKSETDHGVLPGL